MHEIEFRGRNVQVDCKNSVNRAKSHRGFSFTHESCDWSAVVNRYGEFEIFANDILKVCGTPTIRRTRNISVLTTVNLQFESAVGAHEDIVRNGNSFQCPHQYCIRLLTPSEKRLAVHQYNKNHSIHGIVKDILPPGIEHFSIFCVVLLTRAGLITFSD